MSGIPGGGAGQLFHPWAVAIDPSGNVYVDDQYNSRVAEFSSTGAFIAAYGWGVVDGAFAFESCTSICLAGINGGGAGAFNYPVGIASDASGNIYVADSYERIQKFANTGTTDLAIGAPPSDVNTPATSSSGATVTYIAPTATDEGGETPAVSCDHASGSTFPLGTTTVTCTATDSDDTPSSVSNSFTVTVYIPPPPTSKINVRFHYSANGSAGGWSGTKTVSSSGAITIGPQAMEGNLLVNPGDTLQVGYDFTMPGSHPATNLGFFSTTVTFHAVCAAGSGGGTIVVSVPSEQYSDPLNSSAWYPSGNQQSPLVYQGSVAVPDLCAGGTMSLRNGGTFSATVGAL